MRAPVRRFALTAIAIAFLAALLGGCDSDDRRGPTGTDPDLAVPTGLQAHYDTLEGRVHLTWERSASAETRGYLLYRTLGAAEIPQLVNTEFLIKDTVYIDTLGDKVPLSGETSAVYRLKGQDDAVTTSDFSQPASVTVVPTDLVRTRLTWGYLGRFGATVSIRDTARVEVTYRNRTRGNVSLRAGLPGREDALVTRPVSGREGFVVLPLPCDTAGRQKFWIAATDEGGAEWTDTLEVIVERDIPTLAIRKDTTVAFGAETPFHAVATDRMGTLAAMEWDFDGAGSRYAYVRVSSPDTVFRPDFGDARPYFRITDDDGNTVVDSFHLSVLPRKTSLSLVEMGGDGRSVTLVSTTQADADLWRYVLTFTGDTSGTWSTLAFAPEDSLRVVANNLLPAHPYQFRLVAEDSGGLATAGETLSLETAPGAAWILHDTLHHIPYSLSAARAHAIDGRFYLVGFYGDSLFSYEPATRIWQPKANTRRSSKPVTFNRRESIVAGGKIFVMGGHEHNWSSIYMESLNLSYDPRTDAWSERRPIPTVRNRHGLAVVGDFIYVIGGETVVGSGKGTVVGTAAVDIYDWVRDDWKSGPSLPAPASPAAVAYLDGKIVCLANGRRLELAPGDSGWTDVGALPVPGESQYHDEAGRIYFFGRDTLTRYDLKTEAWETRPIMADRRDFGCVAGLEGRIYLFGGMISNLSGGGYFRTIDIYHPSLDGL